MANGSLITNLGKNILLNRAYKANPDYTAPTQFKVGISNGTPAVTDTDLDVPVPISGTESVDDCDVANWTDDAEMTSTLNNVTFKEGTGSLNLIKDAGAAQTASTDKTTTSRNFTSKELSNWLYIIDATALAKLDATDSVIIRFGSDGTGATDYYQKAWDLTDLAVGWNYLYFTSATADSTAGAPVIAAMDYSYIALKATGAAIVWSAGDIIMDDWKVASSDDFLKDVVSGYPTFDESNHEVTMRATVTVTEANGYPINGLGLFNTDSTIKLASEDTFDDESKSDTDEFVFITVDRIV